MSSDSLTSSHLTRPLILFAAVLSLSATMTPRAAVGATVRIETRVAAPVDEVWAAVRDVGAVHSRLAPGFIANTQLEGEVRTVTFANGAVVRERIVSIDDSIRRLGYSAIDGLPTFHFSSIEVVPNLLSNAAIRLDAVTPLHIWWKTPWHFDRRQLCTDNGSHLTRPV